MDHEVLQDFFTKGRIVAIGDPCFSATTFVVILLLPALCRAAFTDNALTAIAALDLVFQKIGHFETAFSEAVFIDFLLDFCKDVGIDDLREDIIESRTIEVIHARIAFVFQYLIDRILCKRFAFIGVAHRGQVANDVFHEYPVRILGVDISHDVGLLLDDGCLLVDVLIAVGNGSTRQVPFQTAFVITALDLLRELCGIEFGNGFQKPLIDDRFGTIGDMLRRGHDFNAVVF